MHFNEHFNITGHAFLSPSKYAWVRYDEDKLISAYTAAQAAARGDRLHDLARRLIEERIPLPEQNKTLNLYVNDAIGHRMNAEQKLFYSANAYGTADACTFAERQKTFRCYDLKTGITPASVDQLLVLAALFCLEYEFRPFKINFDLRLYQNDQVLKFDTDPDDVFHIMDKIVTYDRIIKTMKTEGLA